MSKHTPGPWRVYVPESVGATFGIDSVDGNAVVWFGTTSADGIRRIEDARLIAAAPELLEACQTFAEWLRREEGGFPAETRFNTPEGEAKWREWFDENLRICDLAQTQARAAIAKATGELQ